MSRHLLKLIWSRKRGNALLILEIFVSFIVLFAVSILGLTYLDRVRQPLGFTYENLYTISIDEAEFDYETRMAEEGERIAQIMRELEALPEVIAASGMYLAPFELAMAGEDLTFEDRSVEAGTTATTDDGAATLGIHVVRGRWFDATDDALDWTPIVINRKLAEELFGEEDPIGKAVNEDPPQRVVGVVEDFRNDGALARLKPFFIRRLSLQKPGDTVPRRIVLKTRPGSTAEFEARTLKRVQALVPEWTFRIERTDSIRRRNLKLTIAPFLVAVLVSGSLMIMVVLGMIGVFWQSVTQRTDEIGLRRALGSARGNIYRQFLAEILIITTIGAILAAVVMVQLPLLGVLSVGWDRIAAALALAFGLMVAMATSSGLYPAWLAGRIEPAQALHYE